MGFDIFIAHAEQLASIPGAGFAIGLPWWDYYVPMSLRGRGVDIKTLSDRFASHLNHDGRWDQASWLKFGTLFAAQIVESAGGRAVDPVIQGNDFRMLAANCGRTIELARTASARDRLISPIIGSKSNIGQYIGRHNFKLARKSLARIAHQTVDLARSFGTVRGGDVQELP